MFNPKHYFDNENQKEALDFDEIKKRLDDLMKKAAGSSPAKKAFLETCIQTMQKAMDASAQREKNDYAGLKKLNERYNREISPENYEESFANPAYASARLGKDNGSLLSAFYSDIRRARAFAFHGMEFALARLYEGIEGLSSLLLTDSQKSWTKIPAFYCQWKREMNNVLSGIDFRRQHDPAYRFYHDIILDQDLHSQDYLYLYDASIGEYEIRISRHFAQMEKKKLHTLAETIVQGYIRGFESSNKDLASKKTVMLIYNIGQERLVKEIMALLENAGLSLVLPSPASTPVNRQYQYDHKFDFALTLTSEEIHRREKEARMTYEENRSLAQFYSGIIYIDKFGEKPFSPQMKDEAARLSKEQQPLYRELLGRLQAVRQEYMPRSESSFCIIAFPTPEIGEHFETLFDATVEINSLDNKTWETLQQKIIDVIDRARFIHVKGTGANKTDINVMMQPLRDPEKETNFVNCTADVNIPVGEVFTSPQLKGTKGVLHLEETFLNGLKYENLQLHFKDGHISDYSCSNFQSEAENRKYIEENLLNHREELPIGEFAIGTNTLAYKVAVQYNIMPLLPILIIEKMGPHFAIGDTCFSHEEDHTTFNPDGKKITAVDNEVSALRKTDPQKAYTNCHTDITLPYEGLEHITAVFPDGTASPIIKDGLFAIDGLEKLNEPLLELRKR